jgi:hypothetical protein
MNTLINKIDIPMKKFIKVEYDIFVLTLPTSCRDIGISLRFDPHCIVLSPINCFHQHHINPKSQK